MWDFTKGNGDENANTEEANSMEKWLDLTLCKWLKETKIYHCFSQGKIYNQVWNNGIRESEKHITSIPSLAYYKDGKANKAVYPNWRDFIWKLPLTYLRKSFMDTNILL